MEECRECKHKVTEQAISCPGCGAPYPAKKNGMAGDLSINPRLLYWACRFFISHLNIVQTKYRLLRSV